MKNFDSKTVLQIVLSVLLAGGLSLYALTLFGISPRAEITAVVDSLHLRQVAYQDEQGEIFESDEHVEFEGSFAADDVVEVDAFLEADESVVEEQVETTVNIAAGQLPGEVVTNKFVQSEEQVVEPNEFAPKRNAVAPRLNAILPSGVVVANKFFDSTSEQSLPLENSVADDARQTLARLRNQIERVVPAETNFVTDAKSSDKDFLARFRKKIASANPGIQASIEVEQVPVEQAPVEQVPVEQIPVEQVPVEKVLEIDPAQSASSFQPEPSHSILEVEPAIESVVDPAADDGDAAQTIKEDFQSQRNDRSFLQRVKRRIGAEGQPQGESGQVWYGKLPGENSHVKSIEFNSESSGDQQAELASAKLPARGGGPKPVTQGTTDYKLAGQPPLGYHFKDDTPVTDKRAWEVDVFEEDFSPDAIDPNQVYDPYAQMQVYEGKQLNANQRPLVELGRPWYQLGQLSPGKSFLGFHNNVVPQFIVHGDYRTAVASNTSNRDNVTQVAFELNLNLDLRLTSTERLVGFVAPLDNGRRNTGYLFGEDRFVDVTDFDFDFGYLEGDLGAIVGGLVGETLPFDLPFAVGVMPLLVQNGIWLEDAFLGAAVTIPARNSPRLGISNIDTTFFAGFDEIDSPAFEGDDDTAKMYGVLTFIEALNGYFEIDYAFLEDRDRGRDRSYHNIGLAYSRRYGRFISNSTRVIVNAGQSTEGGPNTADGVLLLSENSLTTAHPTNLIPYINFFAGFDNPQSAARSGSGILRNTGILFESDGITGFPTLDDSANDTFGASFGLNMLAPDFSQQLVLEFSALGVMGENPNRNAAGDQYGLGFRYQLPLSNSVILRVDGMQGFLRNADDNRGLRVEMRHKF